ncbi:MAG: GNAT family N-acetyltransferase [Trueperaceae bacterium]
MSLGAPLPTDEVLEGRLIRLTPLVVEHLPDLTRIAFENTAAFRLTSTPSNPEQAERYFGKAFADRAAGVAHPVTALTREGRVLGTSRITDVDARHLRCELGFTWFDPTVFSTGVNVESKILLLGFAFETLGMHRVQIITDPRNLRSQRAIRALGASYEGVLRRHMVAKDGYVRDSIVFAITDVDWPHLKPQLEARLNRRIEAAGET